MSDGLMHVPTGEFGMGQLYRRDLISRRKLVRLTVGMEGHLISGQVDLSTCDFLQLPSIPASPRNQYQDRLKVPNSGSVSCRTPRTLGVGSRITYMVSNSCLSPGSWLSQESVGTFG